MLRPALEFHAVKLHQLLHEQPDQILHGRELVQVEARSQQGGIEEQPDQVLHGLVILARLQHLKILLLNLVLEDKTLLRRALEFIAVKLLQLLHALLNHRSYHGPHLEALLPEGPRKRYEDTCVKLSPVK